MNLSKCDATFTPARQAFIQEVADNLEAVAKKYNLEIAVGVNDPMVIGIRGCLQPVDQNSPMEPVEMRLMFSGDLQAAQLKNAVNAQMLATQVQPNKFFDLSEPISNRTAIHAEPMPDRRCERAFLVNRTAKSQGAAAPVAVPKTA